MWRGIRWDTLGVGLHECSAAMPPPYYAHSGRRPDFGDWQPLADHLRNVAEVARELTRRACPHDPDLAATAYAAGLLHDLGKYRPQFQLMIRGVPVQKETTYHKQAGAAKAFDARNSPAAFAIAG